MKINIYVLTRNIVQLNAANVVNGTDNNVVKLCQIEHSSIYYLQNFNCRRILTLLVSFFIINSIFSVYIRKTFILRKTVIPINPSCQRQINCDTKFAQQPAQMMRSGWAEEGRQREGRKAGSEVRRERERERGAVRRLLHSRRGSGDMITVSSAPGDIHSVTSGRLSPG